MITSMKDLLTVFGIKDSDILQTQFKESENSGDNQNLNSGSKFTYNNTEYSLMFKWTNGMYLGGNDEEKPPSLGVAKMMSSAGPRIPGLETLPDGNQLQVPLSHSNPLGLVRNVTFNEHKEKLLRPLESPLSPSMLRMKQEEIRLHADAMVDSIKKSKIKSKRIHLAFMFASPLVIFFDKRKSKDDKKSQSLMKINFRKEFYAIEEALRKTETVVNYYKVCANMDNLTSVLLKNPKVLHFSGHGVKNSVQEIGTTAALKEGEGDFLVFEDNRGCADLVSERMLKDILVKCKNEIEVVFVSSCHSEFIGDIFFNAGIDHVICILESQKISDSASIIFAEAFYEALYTHNELTICQAFAVAKGNVEFQGEGSQVQTGEHNKYVLKCRHKSKKCAIFDDDLQLGNIQNMSPEPLFKNPPGKID